MHRSFSCNALDAVHGRVAGPLQSSPRELTYFDVLGHKWYLIRLLTRQSQGTYCCMPVPTLVPMPCPTDVTCLYELDRNPPTVALPASIWCMALSVVDGPVTSKLSAVCSCVPSVSQCSLCVRVPVLSFEYLFHSARTEASGASLLGRWPNKFEKKPEVPPSAGRVLDDILVSA